MVDIDGRHVSRRGQEIVREGRGEDVAKGVMDDLFQQRIADALLQVDTLYREVLVLRFHEEMSLQEIATVTRAPLSTVKSRLYRGLAAIKPKLERSPVARTQTE